MGWNGLERIGTELGVELRGLRGAWGGASQGQVRRLQEASLNGLQPHLFARKITRPLLKPHSHLVLPIFLPPGSLGQPRLQARSAWPIDLCSSPSTLTPDFPRNWVKGCGVGQQGLYPGTLGFEQLAA